MPSKYLTVTVTPGHKYADGDYCTIPTLNLLGTPSVAVLAQMDLIDDVEITTAADKQPIVWDTGTSKFINGTVGGAYVQSFSPASATAAGVGGAVPAPLAGDQDKFLRGDGTFAIPSPDISSVYYYFVGNIR